MREVSTSVLVRQWGWATALTERLLNATADPAEVATSEGRAARDANIAALTPIVATHHDDLARVAFVVTGLQKPAQAAVQSAWGKVWRQLPTMPAERLRAWLFATAVKEARVVSEAGANAAGTGDAGAPVTQAASDIAYRADELALANSLAELDVHDRQIVALRYIGSLDSDEIGRELGMSGNAVLARVARILGRLMNDPKFVQGHADTVDQYERALAGQLMVLTNRAIVPLEPKTVAETAIDTAPEANPAEQVAVVLEVLLERLRALDRRLWLALGGFAAVVLAASVLGSIGRGVAVPAGQERMCIPDELAAKVTAWNLNGNERIGSAELRNISSGACLVDPQPEPWLVDQRGIRLIAGADQDVGPIWIDAGQVLHTRVTVRDYCGDAPTAPVTLAFRQGTDVIQAQPLNPTDTSGVPPCRTAGGGTILMDPWRS